MRTITLCLFLAICGSVRIVNCQLGDGPPFYWLSPNMQYDFPWDLDSSSESNERSESYESVADEQQLQSISTLFSSSFSSSSSSFSESEDESAIFESLINSDDEDRGQENIQDALPDGLPTDQEYDDENEQSSFSQIDAIDVDSESSESSSDSESGESNPTSIYDTSSDSDDSNLDEEFMRRFYWLIELLKSANVEDTIVSEFEDSQKESSDSPGSQDEKTMESVDSMDGSSSEQTKSNDTPSFVRNVDENVPQSSEVDNSSETLIFSTTEIISSDNSDTDDFAYLSVPVPSTESLPSESDNIEDTVDDSNNEYETETEAKTDITTELDPENEYVTGTVSATEEISSTTCDSDQMNENVQSTEDSLIFSTESDAVGESIQNENEEEWPRTSTSTSSTDDLVEYAEISVSDEPLSRQDEGTDTSSVGIVYESESNSNRETDWDFKEPNKQADFENIQKSETEQNWVDEDQNKPIEKDIKENEITKDEIPEKKTPEKPMISIGKFLRTLIGMMH